MFLKKNLRCHIRPIKAFSKTPPKVHRMHFKRQNMIADCSAVKLNFKQFSFRIICSLWTKIIFFCIIISLLSYVLVAFLFKTETRMFLQHHQSLDFVATIKETAHFAQLLFTILITREFSLPEKPGSLKSASQVPRLT